MQCGVVTAKPPFFVHSFTPKWIPTSLRWFSTAPSRNIAKCYRILGVPNESDQETVRLAFLELVKRFHPDSKSQEADASKFSEIENAYRTLQSEFIKSRYDQNEGKGKYGIFYKETSEDSLEEPDIKHTAPQHRQYLSHHGYGMGTPFQRDKQFAQHRASQAAHRVTEYKVSRITNETSTELQKKQEKSKVRDIRTGFGMERLVEDLIQESMTRGEFDNLGGKGKPLKSRTSHNPYVDFTTHKMNEVLIDNGFTPQWITLAKEIREHRDQIRKNLQKTRAKIGPLPLNADDLTYWSTTLERLEHDVQYLNSKIDFYNLVVPILHKQMTHFSLPLEAEKMLKDSMQTTTTQKISEEPKPSISGDDGSTWWNLLIRFFFRR
uniref:J domain-containing protein n=1 Tax=Lygus hesperus TaxID=30085 RepID=A0A0K8TG99_LYGHE